jgi:hypothetical protein
MDTVSIAIIIAGIASIAMAIFGRIRPDIVWKNRLNSAVATPERQKFGFLVLLLFGIMMILVAVAISIPQWEAIQSAVVITIAIVMTVIMLFLFWKYVLNQIEGFRTIGLVLTIIAAVALIVLCVYYWHVTLG